MGSSGGSTSTNKFEPPGYTQQPWEDFVKNATNLANPSNFQPYGGQTVANLSPTTGAAIQNINSFAMNGSPERSATGAAVLNATQGNMNPYATVANPYMGDNPYLQDMLKNSNDLISSNFAKGTAAQTDASAAQQGAFGGSAYNEKQNDNARTLAGSLAANTNNLLSANYNQSANMAENALNRATGAYDNTQNRALQGAQVGLGQQAADQSAFGQQLGAGQYEQQYQQQLLNAALQNFQGQQQAPFSASDFLRNALLSASGVGGTNTSTGPGGSNLMGLLGAGAAGYGLFNQ